MESINRADRLAAVRAEIARACRDAGRDPASVTLIAVAKTFGAAAIEPVIAAGQRVFGENRVQEAKAKWPALRARHGDLELHLVGSLQSNKAREAVALFDAIHSLDRASLAAALGQGDRGAGAPSLPLRRDQYRCGAAKGRRAAAGRRCLSRRLSRPLRSRHFGTSCASRRWTRRRPPHFALTAQIARRNGLTFLSMGMSADFATAIAFGATHVRIGTAIFGERASLR